jgi:hypothetical protein
VKGLSLCRAQTCPSASIAKAHQDSPAPSSTPTPRSQSSLRTSSPEIRPRGISASGPQSWSRAPIVSLFHYLNRSLLACPKRSAPRIVSAPDTFAAYSRSSYIFQSSLKLHCPVVDRRRIVRSRCLLSLPWSNDAAAGMVCRMRYFSIRGHLH